MSNFFRLQAYERVRISLVMVIAMNDCEKDKISSWSCDVFPFQRRCVLIQQLKQCQKGWVVLNYECEGVPFVNRICKKENCDTRKLRKNSELRVRIDLTTLRPINEPSCLSSAKMVYNRVRGWTPGVNLPVKNFAGCPPPSRGREIHIKKSSGLSGIIPSGLNWILKLKKSPFTAHE